jgi:uncharacterized protein (TIGR02145 family)
MKKHFILLLLASAMMLFAGCAEDDPTNPIVGDPTPELSIAPASINATAAAGSYSITITSNVSWTATTTAEWLTLSPASGEGNGAVTVNVTGNTTVEARNATITVAAGTLTETVTLVQAGVNPALAVNPATIDAPANAGSYTVAVTSNTTWTATTTASWLTLSPASGDGNGTVTVNVTGNTTLEARNATITVAAGALTETVTVTQAGVAPALAVSPTIMDADANAGSYTVTVTSNTTWTATTTAEWLTLSPASGNGNGTVTVNVTGNTTVEARSATIIVAAGALTETVIVMQAGVAAVLEITPATIDAVADAGSYSITVTSNTIWTATGNASWLTISPVIGEGNGTVNVELAGNPAMETRSATVTVTAGALVETVTVTQEAAPAPTLPPYAASTQIWTIGEQTWSDAIHVPECNKGDFESSYTDPHCRSYTSGETTYYYYNWPYADQNAEALCPSPWHVPTTSDFAALNVELGGNISGYIDTWGGAYGGDANGGFVDDVGSAGFYWSSTANGSTRAYDLYFNASGGVFPQSNTIMSFGFQVRCVK